MNPRNPNLYPMSRKNNQCKMYRNGYEVMPRTSDLRIGSGNDTIVNLTSIFLLWNNYKRNRRLSMIRSLLIYLCPSLIRKYGRDILKSWSKWELWIYSPPRSISIVFIFLIFLVFIFDWDDTLLCTSYLSALNFSDIPS